MLGNASAGAQWAARFPELKTIRSDRLGLPAYNRIASNEYCNTSTFIDADKNATDKWGTVVENNTNVTECW